jgi:hypothetical protein
MGGFFDYTLYSINLLSIKIAAGSGNLEAKETGAKTGFTTNEPKLPPTKAADIGATAADGVIKNWTTAAITPIKATLPLTT